MSDRIKIFDSELNIMNCIWDNEPVKAVDIAKFAGEKFGWKKNTTYTVIKKLVDKNIAKREEPYFVVSSLVSRDQIQKEETAELIEKLYGGNTKKFITSFLSRENLSKNDIDKIKEIIDSYDD